MRTKAGEGKTPVAIHALITARRSRAKKESPDLTSVRRFLKGKTHCAGKPEARGAKRKLSEANVRKLNSTRKTLLKKVKGEREVHIAEIMAKARVPKVDDTTALRRLKEAYGVSWRVPREKPLRSPEDEAERTAICKKWMRLPANYFTDRLDLFIDNKKFDVPTYPRGRRFHKMQRVRGHLRQRREGLQRQCIKPNVKKNKVNPGGSVTVLAGILNNRVRLWEYLPKRWCGDVAKSMYEGPIIKALRRSRGVKTAYHILEDNDRVGYKSTAGLDAKKKLHIKPIPCQT